MRDFDAAKFFQMTMRDRVIEELRERKPQMDKPNPIEIAEHDPLPRFFLRRFDELHLLIEVSPGLAVIDHPIDPGPELRIERRSELLLPPKVKRQIGIEISEDDIRQERA